MGKNKRTFFWALGCLATAGAIYFLAEYLLYASTDNAQVEGRFVMLAAKVNGYVTKSDTFEGQRVHKDDILIEIDGRDFENSVRQMSGEVTSAEARKNETEKNFKRIQSLFSKGVVTQQQYDMASASYTEAKAKWDSVSAQLAQAQLNLANTKIRAPSDGFIAKKSVEVGQLASPGAPLIGFVDANERWIMANFKETDLDRIHVGAKVKITIDAIDSKTYSGQVDTISAATGATFTLLPPDNATGNFTKVVQRVPVRIRFQNLNEQDINELRVGLSAYVRVSVH